MKRRGFLAALLGFVAAPIAAKAAEVLPADEWFAQGDVTYASSYGESIPAITGIQRVWKDGEIIWCTERRKL